MLRRRRVPTHHQGLMVPSDQRITIAAMEIYTGAWDYKGRDNENSVVIIGWIFILLKVNLLLVRERRERGEERGERGERDD